MDASVLLVEAVNSYAGLESFHVEDEYLIRRSKLAARLGLLLEFLRGILRRIGLDIVRPLTGPLCSIDTRW